MTKKIGRPRIDPLDFLSRDRLPDTRGLLKAIHLESHPLALSWKPARAGAMLGLAAGAENRGHVWMTLDQFKAWMEKHAKLNGHGSAEILANEINIGGQRRRSIMEGDPVSKMEALAMAHYGLGLALPIAEGDCETFSAWTVERFGGTPSICLALGVRENHIPDRMRGYHMKSGQRLPRAPERHLLRAMDWVWRVGPASPFGDRLPVAFFPGQPKELT